MWVNGMIIRGVKFAVDIAVRLQDEINLKTAFESVDGN
jgi:hypothetical protein